MNLHSLFFTHANIHIRSPQKSFAAWLDVWCTRHTGGKQTISCFFCREFLSLGWPVSIYNNGKTAGHWSCGTERNGQVRQTGHITYRLLHFKIFSFSLRWVLFPPPRTHTYTQFVSFLLHLISGFHSLDVFFLCCCNDFGRYWLN